MTKPDKKVDKIIQTRKKVTKPDKKVDKIVQTRKKVTKPDKKVDKIVQRKSGQSCPKTRKSYTLLMNVKLDDNSCKSIYVRPSFFLNVILTLSCSKTHESIFLSITVQICESAIETEFSTSSGKKAFFPRIFELRIAEGVFDISKQRNT